MQHQTKSRLRFQDTPRDKPRGDRIEHANLERPGARAHPRAAGGFSRIEPAANWRPR